MKSTDVDGDVDKSDSKLRIGVADMVTRQHGYCVVLLPKTRVVVTVIPD